MTLKCPNKLRLNRGYPRESWIVDFKLWIPDSRYWIPSFLSVELGFRISLFNGIPDSGFQSLGFGISRHFPDSGIQITWQGATRTTCTASQTEPHEVKAQCLPLLYGRSFRFPTQTEQVESTDTEYHPRNAFLVQCSNPTLKWCLRSIKKQDLFTFLKPCIMKWF